MTEHDVRADATASRTNHSGGATTDDDGGVGSTFKQVSFWKGEEEEGMINPSSNDVTRSDNSSSQEQNRPSSSATIMGNSWRGGSSSSRSDNPSSTGSASASGSSTTSDYLQSTRSHASSSIPSLGERLIRTQKHRDPLRYYDIIEQLGSGSMGDVCKVRKRTFGGSARQSFVEREKEAHKKDCFSWPCFSLFCIPGRGGGSNNKSRTINSSLVSFSFLDSTRSSDDASGSSSHNANASNNKLMSERTKKQRQYASHKQTSSMISYGSQVKVDFALKTIVLDQCGNTTLRNELVHEINVLRSLDHPNIVRALESYDYQNRLFLVLELCNGGTLYERDPYTEDHAKSIVYTLLDAIAYLHSKSITHRDLKYENIMFASPTSDTIKIIDFGLSKKYGKAVHNNNPEQQDMMMKDFVGTVYTMAPEVIRGKYDEKCDVWSLGVLAFILLSSCVPFWGDTDRDVMRKILRNQWDFDSVDRWKEISPDAKTFIQSILTKEADQRPSATQAMEDPWFQRKGKRQQTSLSDNETNNFVEQSSSPTISWTVLDRVHATIRTFAGYSRLKKLALLVIAHQSIDEEIGFLRRLFLQRFDTQKSNPNVSYEEFRVALRGGEINDGNEYSYDYSDDELWSMFTGMDVDGTGKVSFTEFLAATIEAHGSIEEERIAEAFDRIDCDDTGYITVDNLRDVLGNEVDAVFVDELIQEVKSEKDEEEDRGIINYEDFLGLWDSKGDETLRLNLLEVQQRRRRGCSSRMRDGHSSSGSSALGSKLKTGEEENRNVTAISPAAQQNPRTTTKTGTSGHHFFEKEKAKSLRGVWI